MTSSERNEGKVSLLELVREYWRAYGGFRELYRSPYLALALALVPLTYGLWSRPLWWESVLSILPSLLGISLAAFTLFLSAGSEGFRELIAGQEPNEPGGEESEPSPFFKVATVFLHFLVVQFIAILLAIVAKSFYAVEVFPWFEPWNGFASLFFWAFCYSFFLYSIAAIMAASFGVYEVVRWFDEYVRDKRSGG